MSPDTQRRIIQLLMLEREFDGIGQEAIENTLPEAIEALAITARSREASPTPRPQFVSRDLSEKPCPSFIK